MRILLLNTPEEYKIKNLGTLDSSPTDFFSHGLFDLMSVASALGKEDHEIKILDTVTKGMNIKETVKYIVQYSPDVMVSYIVTEKLYATKVILKAIKQLSPEIKIIVFGGHVNKFLTETLKWGLTDYGFIGNYYNFCNIIKLLEGKFNYEDIPGLGFLKDGKVIINKKQDNHLDKFIALNNKLIDMDDYRGGVNENIIMPIIFSQEFVCEGNRKKYFKRTEQVLREIQENIEIGIKEFFICGSGQLFRSKLIELCHAIIKNKIKFKWSAQLEIYPFDRETIKLIKKAGASCLFVSLPIFTLGDDRYSEKIKYFFDLCKEYKIETVLKIIVGCPNEPENYENFLYQNLKRIAPNYLNFYLFYPLPKTKYYNKILKEGLLKEDFWLDFAKNPSRNFTLPDVVYKKNLLEKVERWKKNYYFSSGFIMKKAVGLIPSPSLFGLKIRTSLKLFFGDK